MATSRLADESSRSAPGPADIAAMVRTAHLPALLVALAEALGDLSLLRDDLRPDPLLIHDPFGGLSAEQRSAGRALAAEALGLLLAEGPPAGNGPRARKVADPEALRPLMDFLAGQELSDDQVQLLTEELGVEGDDRRAPDWRLKELDPDRELRVVIVGAGMSGLLVAHRLSQAGVEYLVVEKNADVGGTWFENAYPGCRVDVPNHLYSYSFLQRDDWPQRFSPQDVLLDYFRHSADHLDLRRHIRFETEVVSAAFREDRDEWEVVVRGPGGREETLRADVVVSAVGQLNRPSWPAIEGRDEFAGPSFHSAQWDSGVDLKGRRVAVIGTGASAIQLIPAIAPEVAELHVYQRTPPWFMPTPDYMAPMPEPLQWLLHHVPGYNRWYRLSLFWRLAEGALPAARVDPEWEGDGRSVSWLNEQLRALLVQYLEDQFADRPDLLEQVIPAYPPLSKRILLDDGIWARTLKRDNVELISDPIDRITADGVVSGGRLRPVDVIVYATGFQASRFLMPMRVTGRSGVDLHEHWAGDPRAYLGLTVPGFPNLFCLYGPNTNLVANGSIIFFSECEATYILSALRLLVERRARTLDCRRDLHDQYNRRIDEGNERMAWGAARVNSWYRNANGRISQNWPFTLLEFWQQTREVDAADYLVG
jgi:4-hydroxyacetophenone monooxygenase